MPEVLTQPGEDLPVGAVGLRLQELKDGAEQRATGSRGIRVQDNSGGVARWPVYSIHKPSATSRCWGWSVDAAVQLGRQDRAGETADPGLLGSAKVPV